MAFAGDEFADFAVGDAFADFDDLTAEFVADDPGRVDSAFAPFVPVVDVEVGAAEGSSVNAEFDVAGFDGGFFYFDDFKARRRSRFCDRIHGPDRTSGDVLTDS